MTAVTLEVETKEDYILLQVLEKFSKTYTIKFEIRNIKNGLYEVDVNTPDLGELMRRLKIMADTKVKIKGGGNK